MKNFSILFTSNNNHKCYGLFSNVHKARSKMNQLWKKEINNLKQQNKSIETWRGKFQGKGFGACVIVGFGNWEIIEILNI